MTDPADVPTQENDNSSAIEHQPEAGESKIEAEDTLTMIKQALKGKKKKGVAKKGKKLVIREVPDSLKRFFNDYGESPHL